RARRAAHSPWPREQPLHRPRPPRRGAGRPDTFLVKRLLRGGRRGGPRSSSHPRKGPRRYRYYVCRQAQKRGWQTCPAPALPAGPIEDVVVQQLQPLAPAVPAEAFVAVWQTLPLAEQARVLHRLVERVDYAAAQQTLSIASRPDAGTALVEELARLATETHP